MAKQQFFGIKYPFERNMQDNYYVDINETYEDEAKSELLHIIFTPKGQRYRMPDFGTDLIKNIFEPNDSETWENIRSDISRQVKKYIPNINFKSINIYRSEEDENMMVAEIIYSVIEGNTEKENKMQIRIS